MIKITLYCLSLYDRFYRPALLCKVRIICICCTTVETETILVLKLQFVWLLSLWSYSFTILLFLYKIETKKKKFFFSRPLTFLLVADQILERAVLFLTCSVTLELWLLHLPQSQSSSLTPCQPQWLFWPSKIMVVYIYPSVFDLVFPLPGMLPWDSHIAPVLPFLKLSSSGIFSMRPALIPRF